jgi:hypothetical protein
MSITFRDPPSFWRETLAVTIGAAAAGVVLPLLVTTLPLAVVAPAGALLGGSIGAAVTRKRPKSGLVRAALGAVGGTLAALGHVALSTKFGLDLTGAIAGGALGGLALGGLLAGDEEDSTRSTVIGTVGATALGAIGVAGANQIAVYTAAEGASTVIAGGTIAGLLGLWVAAGAGLRRIEEVRDPLVVRYENLAEALKDPVASRVAEGMAAYQDIIANLERDESIGAVTGAEAKGHAVELTTAMLNTAEGWARIIGDSAGPSVEDIDEKLADLNMRTQSSSDPITLGHLTRAAQALRAQKTALEGLSVGRQRAEAAVDAQVALLDRLRLCIVQHQASDRERFALELNAVADQVSTLTDDLDSLTAAIAEAEAFSDRRLLADVERAGRRALDLQAGPLDIEEPEAEEQIEEQVEEQVVETV